jgi:tyrosine-protein kinase Etk/Wzc
MNDSEEMIPRRTVGQGAGKSTIKEPSAAESDLDLLGILILLARKKLFIASVVVPVALVALIVSLLLPNEYTAAAKVLPPQQPSPSAAGMLLGQLGGLSGVAGTSLGLKSPADLYVGFLKSRTVADHIIQQFDLRMVYDKQTLVETREALGEKSSLVATKEGLINIAIDDRDPTRAAAIANAYVDELRRLTLSLAVTEAAQRRLFFEEQLRQAKDALAESEIALKLTQEKTGVIKLDDQGKALINAVASIRAQVAAKEIELQAMRTFATEGNPDFTRVRRQLIGLQAELRKLERAQASAPGDVLLSTGQVPEVGLEYLRRFRDVKYQEMIFEVLAKQFEAAKLDEAKEAAIVQVVDRAVPPDRKSKPKRVFIVLLAAFIAFLGAAFLSVIFSEPNDYAQTGTSRAVRMQILLECFSIRKSS